MSKEAAQAFVEKMKSDEAFRERVMAVQDVEARMALIVAEGFDCSADEIGSLQELAELDLSGVVGGGSDAFIGGGACGTAAPCDARVLPEARLIV